MNEYFEALNRADITLGDLSDPKEGYLLLGNGDMQTVISRTSDNIELRLTKNDIWDRRLDTSKDGRLLTTQELLDSILDKADKTTHSYMYFECGGSPFRKEFTEQFQQCFHSYDDHPYPCPLLCAKIVLKQLPVSHESHRLSLSEGSLYSNIGDALIRTRVDALHNCLVLENLPETVVHCFKSITQFEMDEPETGIIDEIAYITQTLPADIDIPEWYFAAASLRQPLTGTLFVSLYTSQNKEACLVEALSIVKRVSENNVNYMTSHISWWENYWRASGIILEDRFIESQWYRELYMLACAARPGKTAPGLYAGITQDHLLWHGDYHWDINMQMTYWGCYSSNHPEFGDIYDDLVLSLLERAKWLSETLYGVQGAFFPIASFLDEPNDPRTCKAKNGRQQLENTWGRMLGTSGFILQNLWRHYLYTEDESLLRRIYPALYETAMFYVNWGKLYPSVSPEHWGFYPKLKYNKNGAYDICMIRYTLKAAASASEKLDVNEQERRRWNEFEKSLPSYPTYGEGDDLLLVDMESAPPREYNLAVPIIPVYPGEDFTHTTDMRDELIRTYHSLQFSFYDAIVLGMVAIRLELPDAFQRFRLLMKRTSKLNGRLGTLPEFHNYDSITCVVQESGVLAPINELLIQSYNGVIKLFPAWNRNLAASFKTLLTERAFLVSASILDKKVGNVLITSLAGNNCIIKNEWALPAVTDENGNAQSWQLMDGLINFITDKGATYRVGETLD